MNVENKCKLLGCQAVCCDDLVMDMDRGEFQEFTGSLSDTTLIQEVPPREFSIVRGDTTLSEGIYYSRDGELVMVFISGPCPELKEHVCKIWGESRRPQACVEEPIGGKNCLRRRKRVGLFDLTKGIP